MTTATLQTLSVLIHGDSKTGKSTLAGTAPKPMLIIDAEGSTKFLPYHMIGWDPLTSPPPEPDGTWEICVVTASNWLVVQKVYEWLSQAPHGFKSFCMDSITEIQRRCKESISTDSFRIQDWGTLLLFMDRTIRGFRDLTLDPHNRIQCAVFVAETRMKDGKWRPAMQGGIEVSLPYWMDIVGYLFAQPVANADGSPGDLVRQLLISPHPQYVSGERVAGRLPAVVSAPNINEMFDAVYPAAATTNGTTKTKPLTKAN